jgi:putative modified peptide
MASHFSPELADKLLDKLSSDDAFRAAFDHNPRAALKQLGYETPEADRDVRGADPALCLYSARALPSKESFRAARNELRAQLTAPADTFRIFNLG